MKTKFFSLFVSTLIFFFFLSISYAEPQPKFYFSFYPEFVGLKAETQQGSYKKRWSKIEALFHKYQNKIKRHPGRTVIPGKIAKNILLPRMGEKLWVFKDSKFIGITKIKNFYLYESEISPEHDLNFEVDAKKLVGKLEGAIYISIPDGIKKKNLPKENDIKNISFQEAVLIVKKMDGIDQLRIEPYPTPRPTVQPTVTPVLNFKEKTSNFIKNILVEPTLTPYPNLLVPAYPILFLRWAEIGEIEKSLVFPYENVEILQVKAPYKPNHPLRGKWMLRTVCKIKDNLVDCHSLLGLSEEETRPNIVQTFWVMGSNYVVFSSFTSGSHNFIVCKVIKEGLVPVYKKGYAWD